MLNRDDIIRMAREAGIEFSISPMAMVTQSELQRFAELVAAKETEARKATQLETIALREELTKRAMQSEKEAYQRGVRDERMQIVAMCENEKVEVIDETDVSYNLALDHAADAIRSRNNNENQQ